MDATTRSMLNDAEQELLRGTTRSKLAKLDEDELIDLHTRIRRARTKYVKLHRRRGAAQVRKDGSRTRASGSVSKTAVKAEAFEEALGAVSARLAEVAARAAEDLKAERLAAASKTKSGKKATRAGKDGRGGGSGGKGKKGSGSRARERTPVEKKRNAASRASKGRKQARRDARR
jgi:hypothetical protein